MTHNKFLMLSVLFYFFSAGAVNAELKSTSPNEVCDYLNGLELTTQGWIIEAATQFGCSSSYERLGAGFPPSNNLAYHAQGTASSVSVVKLVLNVNSPETAKAALHKLLKAAEQLSLKATGEKLPKPVKTAILSGKSFTTKIDKATIEVVKFDWLTGKGYEITVIIN